MLVSNTSTPVLLAKTNCLEDFIRISPVIAIPPDVKTELLVDEESYYAKLVQKLIDNKKIVVRKPTESKAFSVRSGFRLGAGEAAAYALFDKKKHEAILTDDGELIKLCKLEEVPFICAMTAVIRLFEKGALSKEDALEKLDELKNIGRYSKEIYEYFKAEVK